MPVRIGTSGWQYPAWKRTFYPGHLPQGEWLGYYASRFSTVEVNNTFYRLPEATRFEDWARRTPDDFVVAVKASRYLSHIRRLSDPAEAVDRLVTRAGHLGQKLGPVLLQLPSNFGADDLLLRDALDCFPRGLRVAFEPRHASWYRDETAEILADHDAALCLTDTGSRPSPVWRTAAWTYLRLHGGRATPVPCYGRSALRSWAERLAGHWGDDEECYVYFNNDQRTCAVRDARRFASAAAQAGLTPTRVPRAREVSVDQR